MRKPGSLIVFVFAIAASLGFFIGCARSVDQASVGLSPDLADNRSYNSIVDSILNAQGVDLPDSVLVGDGICQSPRPIMNRRAFDVYFEECEKETRVDRLGFFVELEESDTTYVLLLIVVRTDVTGGTCVLWPDEGFWRGERPARRFTSPILESECGGENKPEFIRLVNQLDQLISASE